MFTPLFQGVLYDLVDESLVSDCPLPCKTTQSQAKHLYQHTLTWTQIYITFSSKVKVTRTDLVKPALSIFLSEVGLKRRKLSLIEFNFRLVGRWVSGWVLGRFKCFSSQWIFFCWCHINARACRNRFLPFHFNIKHYVGYTSLVDGSWTGPTTPKVPFHTLSSGSLTIFTSDHNMTTFSSQANVHPGQTLPSTTRAES